MLIIGKKDILILGKVPKQRLNDTTLTVQKEYAINFNGVEIYKFKLKDSEIDAALLCLSNVSKDPFTDNMKKLDCRDMHMIF